MYMNHRRMDSGVARGGRIYFDRGMDIELVQNINQNLKGATLIIS